MEKVTKIKRDAAFITAQDYENTAMLRVYTDLIYERLLPTDFRERLGIILVHGLVAHTQHAWLCVEGKVSEVSPEADRCERLEKTLHISSVGLFRWRVMIDVCALEIEPSILLIAPTAPLAPQYIEQERFTAPIDYSTLLASKEGSADETKEELILKALVNKHV
jgi:hypothetical protein